MTEPTLPATEHLGDGAYASTCPQGIVLTANHHDPREATDRVWLEPDVARNAVRWMQAWLDAYDALKEMKL